MAAPVTRIELVSGLYFDSVFLMGISARAKQLPEVDEAVVVLATPANVETLVNAGFAADEMSAARPDDLIVGINRYRIRSIEDLSRLVAASGSLVIEFLREDRAYYLTIE